VKMQEYETLRVEIEQIHLEAEAARRKRGAADT